MRWPLCTNESYCRDLCNTDYQVYWDLVDHGQTSWDELQAAGLCGPLKRTVRKDVMAAVEAFRRRKKL